MDTNTLDILFNHSLLGVAFIYADGTLKYVNQAFLSMFHLAKTEIAAENFFKLMDFGEKENISFKNMFTGKSNTIALDKRIVKKDTTTAWINIHAHIVYDENNIKYGLAILADVAREKAYENEIIMKSLAVDSSMAGIIITSIEGKVIYVNRALLEIGGFNHENELVGKMSTIFKFDPEKLEAIRDIVMKQGQWTGEMQTERKDGTPLHLLVSVVLITDSEGKPAGRLTSFIDITWRKKAEETLIKLNFSLADKNKEITQTLTDLMAAQDKLKAAHKELHNKNFELDEFVYKTSHDLRSPLTTILGLVHLLKTQKDEAEKSTYIDLIENRITKLDKFIKSMLDYSRNIRSAVKSEKIDFNELLKECLEELAYIKNFNHLHISSDLESTIDFYSDFFRLKVIFNNIISNAIKYQNLLLEESVLHIRIKVVEGQCQINFTDNGIGIHPEYVDNIFNMFVRASAQAEGSGLGMYIVKQAVQILNGTINLQSEYGSGTEINIVLPSIK